MRILYFNVIEQNAGWGAEFFLNKAFNDIGVETIPIDYRKNRFRLVKRLKEIEGDFDVIFLQRGDNFPLEILRAINRPRFFWSTELFSRRVDQGIMLSSGLFDHLFVLEDFGRDQVIKNGWAKPDEISTMVGGFDSETHNKKEGIKKDIDISFVGSMLPRRRKIIDELNKKFKVSEFKAYGKGMSEIMNRSKITLNIHAEDHLDTETRVFEALGSGAFLISEKLTAQNPFKNGIHFVEVNNIEEMEEKIEYYLGHDEEREKIAKAGHEEAMKNHTYLARAKQFTDIMEKYVNSKDSKKLPAIDLKKLDEYKAKEFFSFICYGIPHIIKMKLSKLKKKFS